MNVYNYKVAVIVVTYNRKELLLRCLTSLVKQTYKPTSIYIIDNASTDGTQEYIQENSKQINTDVDIQYHKMLKNGGGAGGFYYGLKIAHETKKYDAYVLMDDDGIADNKELEELIKYTKQYSYINALVINETDYTKTSMPRKNYGYDRVLIEQESNQDGIIINYACPFNGTLLTKELVNKVGYPIPELFFLGDESNFHKRSINAGFTPVTIITAKHYHPSKNEKIYQFNLGFKKICLNVENTPIRIYCKHRNIVYNRFSLHDYIYIFITYFLYSYLYLFCVKSWEKYTIFNHAIWDGLCKNLSKHSKYLK